MSWLRALAAAISLLTRLPVRHGPLGPKELQRSVVFYPVVGLGLGAAWTALAQPYLVAQLGPAPLAALMLAAMVLMTGGLHVDGLADFADGWFGGRGDRQRTLDIMRDSRIGAHGATALVLVLLLAHGGMARQLTRAGAAGTWLVAPVVARTLVAVAAALIPPARPEGLAHSVHNGRALGLATAAMTVGVLILIALAPDQWPAGLAAAAAGAVVQTAAVRRCGGTTGDIHGASIVLAEATFMLLARPG